jgi:endonuclease/exonuclease/phosphatase family metal-dependent hydrolase
MSKVYNNTHQELARLSNISYEDVDNRPSQFTFQNRKFSYNKSKSTGLYCHYENNIHILLGIHGADNVELNLIALGHFYNNNSLNPLIEDFCIKHAELVNDPREVMLVGHSLGCWIVAHCENVNPNNDIGGVFFSPYIPDKNSKQSRFIGQTSKFKKILYDNDWIASNILDIPLNSNILVFTPRVRGQTFINGHSIKHFDASPSEMNRDFVKFIDVKNPQEIQDLIDKDSEIISKLESDVLGIVEDEELKQLRGDKDVIGDFLSSRPSNLDNFMKEKGDLKMNKFDICRSPINSVFKKIVDTLTVGKLSEIQKKLNYDNVFHLYLIITFENGETYSVEKTEVVFVANFEPTRDGECKETNVNKSVTFNQVIEDLEVKLGKNLYRYDIAKYNCQNFLLNFSHASGVTDFDDFIYQDLGEAISPTLRKSLGVLTDIGGVTSRLFSPSIQLEDGGNTSTLSDEEISKPQEQLKSTQLLLMSYNVKMFPSIVADTQINKRAGWIIEEVNKINPDVIVFQELFDDGVTNKFQNGMRGYIHSRKVGGGVRNTTEVFQGKAINGGVMIFSKFPIVSQDQTTFKKSGKEDKYASKGAIRIEIEKDGIPINIIGTHLQAGRKQRHFDIKETQFSQISDLSLSNPPTLIAGDFNVNFNKFSNYMQGVNDDNGWIKLEHNGTSTTNDGISDRDGGNLLDYILYEQNDNWEINGIVNIRNLRNESGYRIDKNPSSNILNSFTDTGTDIKDAFVSKKKRKKRRRRRKRQETEIVHSLSDHKAIMSNITITEKRRKQSKLGEESDKPIEITESFTTRGRGI